MVGVATHVANAALANFAKWMSSDEEEQEDEEDDDGHWVPV